MPKLGLTMIARGAEKTLGACLDSIKDYVDPIVIVLAGKPTDNTETIAYQYTDHVFWYDEELLPDGGISNFAAARNVSLKKLAELTGPDSWFMWVDADDEVVNAENIPGIIQEAIDNGAEGIWLPYHYAFTDRGQCTTFFTRERIMYDPTRYRWLGRVHEVIAPNRPISWGEAREVAIRHSGHQYVSRSDRNLALLHMMLEEEPGNERTLFYLGHQHFANGEWAEAVQWYEGHVRVANNELEKWQSYIYMAKALRKLERYDDALAANAAALVLAPSFKDSYFDLAETYAFKEDFEACLLMAELGRKRESPPPILFLNPLDQMGYNAGVMEEVALFHTGKLDEALAKVRELLRINPAPALMQKEATYMDFVETRDKAEAWLTILDGQDPDRVVDLSKAIPKRLFNIPEIRNCVHGARALLREDQASEKRVAFYCGEAMEAWSPPSINEGGIGGSETACIEIARRFAADGWQVDVFNNPGRYEGEHDGVCYWHHSRFKPQVPYDLLVSWRQLAALANMNIKAKRMFFWAHDLNYGPLMTPKIADRFDRVLGVSEYHADYLKLVYDFLPAEKVNFVPNGIDLERFADPGVERKRTKVVWLSSPDRGLDVLLSLWPNVIQYYPDAELHIFYGFKNIEKLARANHKYQQWVDTMMRHMDKPGVTYHGRVGQDVLARELWESSIWAYPSAFLETSCISAMEAMAAGVTVLASNIGALSYTVGSIWNPDNPGAGYLLPGHSRSEWYMNKFLGVLLALLADDNIWRAGHEASLKRAPMFSWDKSYEKWKQLLSA